jgi:predicted DNA-binding mobile mystery protein A
MKTLQTGAQSRQTLDARFADWRPVERFKPPVRGWIKAVREALGMSTAQLAKRLRIKQPTVVAIEQSETKGTIQLATLRRVAEAMNCKLVYALVPNEPLDSMVRARARKVARQRLRSVEHTMRLENQSVPAEDFEARIEALARDVSPRTLWDEA